MDGLEIGQSSAMLHGECFHPGPVLFIVSDDVARDRYYSDIDVQTDKGSDKLFCAWIDGNGDQPTTGIQIHWPEFHEGYNGNGNDPS